MYKNAFFILLITFAVIATMVVFNGSQGKSEVVVQTDGNKVVEIPVSNNPNQSKGGIDITVEKIEQLKESTVITLGLNNHSVDLGQDTIYESSTLNGEPSISHEFLSNAVGGHHVEVKVAYEKATSGALEIVASEQASFSFTDIW
ncbi:hypothetical protein HQ524_01735 [Candidatus Uhrbacteria bacterium]|nr:hypothetical protein [Candidatus Uhrbacteria bacterium]